MKTNDLEQEEELKSTAKEISNVRSQILFAN
jgi:hypothetical protein